MVSAIYRERRAREIDGWVVNEDEHEAHMRGARDIFMRVEGGALVAETAGEAVPISVVLALPEAAGYRFGAPSDTLTR